MKSKIHFFSVPPNAELYYNVAHDPLKLVWITNNLSISLDEAKADCESYDQGALYEVKNYDQFSGIEQLIRQHRFEDLNNDPNSIQNNYYKTLILIHDIFQNIHVQILNTVNALCYTLE